MVPGSFSHSCCLLSFSEHDLFPFLFLLLLFQDLPPAVCLPPLSALVSLPNSPGGAPGLPFFPGDSKQLSPGAPFPSPCTWGLRCLFSRRIHIRIQSLTSLCPPCTWGLFTPHPPQPHPTLADPDMAQNLEKWKVAHHCSL